LLIEQPEIKCLRIMPAPALVAFILVGVIHTANVADIGIAQLVDQLLFSVCHNLCFSVEFPDGTVAELRSALSSVSESDRRHQNPRAAEPAPACRASHVSPYGRQGKNRSCPRRNRGRSRVRRRAFPTAAASPTARALS